MTSKTLDHFLQDNLQDLKSKGLYNEIDPLEGANRPSLRLKARNL